jgi:hypothetical protein
VVRVEAEEASGVLETRDGRVGSNKHSLGFRMSRGETMDPLDALGKFLILREHLNPGSPIKLRSAPLNE